MILPGMTVPTPADQRPQFHFTAPEGWINDPNGLVYANGTYHLFYQHNPFGTQWGNMTWGHAVSQDLVHWRHLPAALEPDPMGTMFSGSAIVDRENAAGFGKGALLLFYTAAGGTSEASQGRPFTQCLAWSRDGKTFTKHAENPVLGHVVGENRDPKVVWHAASRQWVMALYLQGHEYGFWGSRDLRRWTELSRHTLEGSGECPDLFPLPLDGDARRQKWVFWGANGLYEVGTFDGTRFLPETGVLRAVWGNTAYAAQTYSNAPRGRCVQVSWFAGSEFPGQAWNQQLGFPNELRLVSTGQGPRLAFAPVREVVGVRGPAVPGRDGTFPAPSGLLDLEGSWQIPAKGRLVLRINGTEIAFDAASHRLAALGKDAEVDTADGRLDLRILADRASLEVYAQKGRVFMPFFVPPAQFRPGSVVLEGGWRGRLKVFELRP